MHAAMLRVIASCSIAKGVTSISVVTCPSYSYILALVQVHVTCM